MKEVIKSPIFYMGSKEKLIRKGLIDMFPKRIDIFYDIFGGSGIVALNAKSNKKIVNDLDNNIINLIKYFQQNSPENIVEEVNDLIKKYKLPTFSTDTRKFKGDREPFKATYNTLRQEYNATKSVKLLYLLNIFSNSHMLRFNSEGGFNMPFGNGYFNEQCKVNILNNKYSTINCVTNKDFREFDIENFLLNDFVYLDPPYLNTTATYNENNGWNLKDEQDLLDLCDTLTSKNIKWAMSNVFENKGKCNQHLIEWVEKNNYNVHYFQNFTYCACGKGSSKTVEVLIMNY